MLVWRDELTAANLSLKSRSPVATRRMTCSVEECSCSPTSIDTDDSSCTSTGIDTEGGLERTLKS